MSKTKTEPLCATCGEPEKGQVHDFRAIDSHSFRVTPSSSKLPFVYKCVMGHSQIRHDTDEPAEAIKCDSCDATAVLCDEESRKLASSSKLEPKPAECPKCHAESEAEAADRCTPTEDECPMTEHQFLNRWPNQAEFDGYVKIQEQIADTMCAEAAPKPAESQLEKLMRRWRDSADKSEHHITDPGMEIENETHMNDMRMCADELEIALKMRATSSPELPRSAQVTDEKENL